MPMAILQAVRMMSSSTNTLLPSEKDITASRLGKRSSWDACRGAIRQADARRLNTDSNGKKTVRKTGLAVLSFVDISRYALAHLSTVICLLSEAKCCNNKSR